MSIEEILAGVEEEIARLQQVKALLGDKRNGSAPLSAAQDGTGQRKRTMSAEARERIAAAQRKRWAKQKKAGKKAA